MRLICVVVLSLWFVAAEREAMADWALWTDASSVTARERAGGGGMELRITCNNRGYSGLQFSGYTGTGLSLEDDVSSELYAKITSARGTVGFRFPVHYYLPDQTHVSSEPLAADFLAVWAAGREMTFLGADGSVVGTWSLSGTSAALNAMREACGQDALSGAPAIVPLSTLPAATGSAPAPVAALTGRDGADASGPSGGGGGDGAFRNEAIRAEVLSMLEGNDLCDTGVPAHISREAVIVRDLTGDGHLDAIVDYNYISCGGFRPFCGVQACSVDLFVNRGGRLEESKNLLSISIKVEPGNRPLIRAVAHGGKPYAVRWNGFEFEFVR
ncbi:MAG: hypothetical protein AAGB11_15055 [Pseudomonadota bacterium]